MADPIYGDLEEVVVNRWLHNPMLATQCSQICLQDIQHCLKNMYTEKMSRMCPVVEDIMRIDLLTEKVFVPVECKVFQRKLQPANVTTVPVYNLRQTGLFSDVLVRTTECFFSKTNQHEYVTNKLILFSGAGGQGKTTQLLKLTLDWCSGTDHVLSNYNLLFYIPLHVNMKYTAIEDLICQPIGLLPTKEKLKLEQLLRYFSSGEKLIFLLDDYEGIHDNGILDSLLNGNIFPSATVILCGRPFWIKNFVCSRPYDVMVDMVGLSESNVEKLCTILLNQDRDVVKFMELCRQKIFDMSLLKVPIFTTLYCYIFQAHHDKGVVDCQQKQTTTTTELFNTMLRLFLKMFMLKTKHPFSETFCRSPFLDSETKLPSNIRRLLYQICKMSFYGVKCQKYKFNQHDLKRFMIDTEEICHLGILICTSRNAKVYQNERYTFEFYNKLFQEYMAGLYLSSESMAWHEITDMFCPRQTENSDNVTEELLDEDDDGYESDDRKKRLPHVKHCWMSRFKSRNKRTVSLDSIPGTSQATSSGVFSENGSHKNKLPTKSTSDECSDLDNNETYMKHNLSMSDVNHKTKELKRIVSPISVKQRHVKKCLYNLLAPFQNVVLFACGSSAVFTKKMLTDCRPYVLRKVCRWNLHKFDIGYEAVLYCETQQDHMLETFYNYLCSTSGKAPSSIQFPTPYDEVATVHFAHDLSNLQAERILLCWYNVNINHDYLQGANISKSDHTFLELSDPCLFEMLLMQKFTHVKVRTVKVTGNYFPGFKMLSASFPNINEIIFDGVNIPSLPHSVKEYINTTTGVLVGLQHMQLINVHSIYPLCPELEEVFQFCYQRLITLCIEHFHCTLSTLFYHISHLKNLERLTLAKMGIRFEDIVSHDKRTSNCLAVCQSTLCVALSQLHYLQSLNLSQNNVGIALTEIVHSLQCHGLEELALQKCRIPTNTFVNFAPMLTKFKQLSQLDLSLNPVAEGLGTVIYWLAQCPALKTLVLRKCNIISSHFKEAAVYLERLTNLSYLDISENLLESATPVLLSHLPLCIEELVICNCSIYSMYAVSSATILKRLRNLSCLNMQDNPVHGGIEPIVNALKKSKSIKELYIQNCRIKPNHFKRILPGLASMSNLTKLGIGKNTCCDDSCDARNVFVKSICQCKRLQKLYCCIFHGKALQEHHVEQIRKHVNEVVIYKVQH